MNINRFFTRPEYFFRPTQAIRRLKRIFNPPINSEIVVPLAWGGCITVNPYETIGAGIYWYGVFDLIVAEVITRLLDKDETALDIGANIGQFSILMAKLVGSKGSVLSFEPHPVLFKKLNQNLEEYLNYGIIQVYNLAIGESPAEGYLIEEEGFLANQGTSRVDLNHSEKTIRHKIKIEKIDNIVINNNISLLKMDVEGFEEFVLRGAGKLLEKKSIRDIIYEDLDFRNSNVTKMLIESGYTIFSLHTDILKPRISTLKKEVVFKNGQEGENFLATLDPDRAIKRMQGWGYKSLSKINNII
jgi:FkbM family methyltransferase